MKQELNTHQRKSIGKNFKKLRKEAGYNSQAELGKIIGVEQSTIGNWERGGNIPNPVYWEKLLIVLNCSLDDLFRPIIKKSLTRKDIDIFIEKMKRIYRNDKARKVLESHLNIFEDVFHIDWEEKREEGRAKSMGTEG